MASSVNATTAGGGGVIATGDSSGILNLQGNGNTGISISATGVPTITTPTVSGTSTFGTATMSSPSGSAPLAMARCWVYFNGASGAVTASRSCWCTALRMSNGRRWSLSTTTIAVGASATAAARRLSGCRQVAACYSITFQLGDRRIVEAE